MFRKQLVIGIVTLCVTVFGHVVSPTLAASTTIPFILIDNREELSITGTETPLVSVRFGNRGQATLEGVFVRCTWDTFIRFTREAQSGPFGGFEFVPGTPPLLFFPSSTPAADQLISLAGGQDFNVAFGIRLALPTPTTKGLAGKIQCDLLDGSSTVLASSQIVTVNVHDSGQKSQ